MKLSKLVLALPVLGRACLVLRLVEVFFVENGLLACPATLVPALLV